MKIHNVTSLELKTNCYTQNKVSKKNSQVKKIQSKDSVEISSEGKQLNSYITYEEHYSDSKKT